MSKAFYSDEEFACLIDDMDYEEILQLVKDFGIKKMRPELPLTHGGIYRRLNGFDLALWDHWKKKWKPCFDDDTMIPVLDPLDYSERWILVMDGDHRPVLNGEVVVLDRNGKRVE